MHGPADTPVSREAASESPDTSPGKDRPSSSASKKDPSRPKRKKARRACAACQRAHLTCDDDRPCERCIKRGLQDDCQDGARKKAKYLQDAPDEALKPGAGAFYNRNSSNGSGQSPPQQTAAPRHSNTSNPMPMADNGFSENRPPSMHGFNSIHNNHQDTSPAQNYASYGTSAAPPNNFQPSFSPQTPSTMQNVPAGYNTMVENNAFDNSFNNPVDSSMFNFDPSSVDFGNQYGGLEFAMLGHMASAANSNMSHGNSNAFDASNMPTSAYINTSNQLNNFPFNNTQGSLGDWQNSEAAMNAWNAQAMNAYDGRNEPNAYTIANPSNNFIGASPGSSTDFMASLEPSTPNSAGAPLRRSVSGRVDPGQVPEQSMGKAEPEHRPSKAISKKLELLPATAATQQRRRNASKIYSSVIKPYPYTARFHALIAAIQRRFKSHKRLRIAKALASIRPSFISCNRTLIDDDLILMEKNFQRSLLEYRDHVASCGTPTIICRRTGEVAYAGESFVLLSGWPSTVLQGKEPNLNVNRAGHNGEDEVASGSMTSSSRGGFTTPKVPSAGPVPTSAEPLPVFITDLLDDDSVIQFYEDFAKIAFADSKGRACRPCRLIKYRTKEDPLMDRLRFHDASATKKKKKQEHEHEGVAKSAAHDHQDISKIGEDNGTVECMFCWTVKRDVFEFPMMVVINFLPILQT